MGEGIVHYSTLSGSIASSGAAKDVVGVGSLCHEGGASVVSHAGEQITSRLVGLGERHVVRFGELVKQIGAGQVLIAELLNRTAVGEPGAADAPIRSEAGCNRLLHGTILGVGFAQLQPCVSRLKLIDSVRLNEKMFDESGIV